MYVLSDSWNRTKYTNRKLVYLKKNPIALEQAGTTAIRPGEVTPRTRLITRKAWKLFFTTRLFFYLVSALSIAVK